jgi:hypothetical protein
MMHPFLEYLENLSFSMWVKDAPTIWAFPTILVLHTIGMAIVAGGSTMLSLVTLGFWPTVPRKPLARVFPYMWGAFWLNAVTGTMMLIADATTKLTMLDFYIKMALVFTGIFMMSRMRRQIFEYPQLDDAPVSGKAKMVAWASMACWLGAITAGRLMAYVK